MKGLLIKDFLNMKRQAVIIAVIFLIYLISFDNLYTSCVMLFVICAVLPITSFSFDELARWDKYVLSMPVSRRDIVISKYCLTIMLFAAATILTFAIFVIFTDTTVGEIGQLCLSMLSVGLLYSSAVLPMLFKFSSNVARYFMLMIVAVLVAVAVIFSKAEIALPGMDILQNMLWLLPVIVVGVLVLSVMASLVIYNKKQL